MMKRVWLLLIVVTLLFPIVASAHRISVFAYQEGNKIRIEGFFSDGTPTKQAAVEVYDASGKKLYSGRTNEKGTLAFDMPKAEGKLKIVLIASMGHRAETIFKLKKAGAGTVSDSQSAGVAEKMVQPKPAAFPEKAAGISEQEIRSIVRDEVAKAIQPVMRALAKQEAEKVSFSDIVGGIGWILGLMGIWMMMKVRKR